MSLKTKRGSLKQRGSELSLEKIKRRFVRVTGASLERERS